MATTCIPNVMRRDLLSGSVLNTSSDVFRMSLYLDSGHGFNTTAYTSTAEVIGTNYTAGGEILATISQSLDTTNNSAYLDWSTDPSWPASSITATDCLIYDDTVASPTANVACYVGDFAGSRSSSNGLFQVTLPSPAYNTAVIRIV